jgi:hypothetical protein
LTSRNLNAITAGGVHDPEILIFFFEIRLHDSNAFAVRRKDRLSIHGARSDRAQLLAFTIK